MKLGRVIGNVWATQKDASITGKRMLLVQPIRSDGTDSQACKISRTAKGRFRNAWARTIPVSP